MPNYAIMRIEKRKLGSVSKICNHHERLKPEYKSNPDIDTRKSDYNYHIIQPEAKYRQLVLARIEEAGAKRRKDSVVMQDALVTASPDWIRAKSIEEQKEYFNYAYEFFEEKYGKENMISAVVHIDEATPHMHICFVPITKDNRLSSKEIIGGPKGLVKLQDEFYEHIHEKYPDLERGLPKRETHRKHLPTAAFKVANELYSHYEEICDAIQKIGLIGNSKSKDEAIALLGRYAPEMAQLKVQLKSTDSHIEYLERKVGRLNYENKQLEREANKYANEINDKEVELFGANRQIYELNYKQKKLEEKIALIPPDILEKLTREEKERRKAERKKERGK